MGGRAGNIAVYATSNRRHLIKETLTDREGDDIHESDTRQELMSLSARFGLTITFGSPDRERYLHIVEELAKQYGVELDPRQLAVRSEAFAVRSGGRSAGWPSSSSSCARPASSADAAAGQYLIKRKGQFP